MSCEIHKNDTGTVLQTKIVDCSDNVIDISSATTKTIILKKPSGSSLEKAANFTTDGTDGYLSYTTQSDDLDEVGTWKIQAYVVTSGGAWKSNFKSFKVHRNL